VYDIRRTDERAYVFLNVRTNRSKDVKNVRYFGNYARARIIRETCK